MYLRHGSQRICNPCERIKREVNFVYTNLAGLQFEKTLVPEGIANPL